MGLNTNSLDEQEVYNLLKDVLIKEDIPDADIEIAIGADKCDGFLSFMTNASAKTKNKKLFFIIKSAPRNEAFREIVPLGAAYNREICFYDKIYPSFVDFQNARKLENPFKAVPKCYKTTISTKGEHIILENLRENGFELWNRKLQMDDEHIALVFKEYAKLHAVSFAMQDQDKELYDKLSGCLDDVFQKFSSTVMNQFIVGADKAISLFNDQPDVQEKLTNLRDNIFPLFDYIAKTKLKYNAISHGDCWSNNMMIKYQNKKPAEVCLLDFQIVRCSTPILDLSYFYYASACKDNYHNLGKQLKLYYNTLTDQVKAMGSDITVLYPFSAFMDDWKKYCRFGYIMTLVLTRAVLKEDDELLDFNDIAENGKTMTDVFGSDNRNITVADERMRVLALHMVNEGYFE